MYGCASRLCVDLSGRPQGIALLACFSKMSLKAEIVCLLRWQAGVNDLEGVACPDVAIEVPGATTTLRCCHIAVECGRIGFDPNRRVTVGDSLCPGEVRAEGAPRLVVGDRVVVRPIQHNNATKKRRRDVNRHEFVANWPIGMDGVAGNSVVVG